MIRLMTNVDKVNNKPSLPDEQLFLRVSHSVYSRSLKTSSCRSLQAPTYYPTVAVASALSGELTARIVADGHGLDTVEEVDNR